ncbi:Uncharacterised protein [Brevundimonas diminuta]|jgi:glutamate mutase epsilon subunit|uniref:DUF465 domain-containing protein n=1 Tax=Brevundimonas diminuta TaxID=293 RepID=A0A246KC19_BREDI|nr:MULTISPECIES: hypothetical protein [Brevundimonas]OJU52949.1 MAG: hypothetical protein BGO02_06695 [Brevundimonas sp. 67-6]EGF96567.1 hypothetical protein BDIM_03720 [Brevundimonas diminuta ATCC 11568]MBD3574404.1 hypothetical protein [Brevundimonas diminuta]MBD3819235.1 hypothetical protein [Brevundimonas diminuta]OMG55668.1 hypothetical protein BJP32_14275 [Brevundimonas sp. ZS04]
MAAHSETDLSEALRAVESLIAKCEKAVLKLAPGAAQHTLLVRRIAALKIARDLIEERLDATR